MPRDPFEPITDDEARASFELVRVDDLPPVDRPDIPVVHTDDGRPCGCDWCQHNWRKIAAASVTIFEEGVDPLDRDAIDARAGELGLANDERGLLLTLFSPTDAIIELRHCGQYTNGMHRVHALRMAGVEVCVVYTGKGEAPWDDDDIT
jgi:hypothetical protein